MRVIILDETLELTQRAHEVLKPMGIQVAFAGSLQELDLALVTSGPRDVLIVNFNGELGSWEVTEQIRGAQFAGKTIALVDQGADSNIGYLAQLPRTEYVARPPSPALLDGLLREIVSETDVPPRSLHRTPPLPTTHGMVGKSKPILEIFSLIEKVAAGDANVCIYGESGTGKELIARAVHNSSARRDRPLVTLDCTAVPEGLMESHLFGHVRGAFTGAIDQREGVFSLANTGTLFIDELGELSLPLQAKLLRVIQTREFFKVGGTKPIRTDIRLITATNKDPKQGVEKGVFREDLYYRVAVVMIKVPPLRERKEDIALLVDHFLRKFAAVYHKPIRGVAPSVMGRLMTSPWPGNVRQLEHFLEQAVVLAEGDTLTEDDLPIEEFSFPAGGLPIPVRSESWLPLREVERRYILHTLEKVNGNRTQAAKLLGISLRCLQYKLKAYFQGTYLALPDNGSAKGLETGWTLSRETRV